MAIWGAPSARAFAFDSLTVQRPSTSFWRALAGFSGQISAAARPSLICAFSPSVVRWRGAATKVASTIWPPRGRYPAAVIARSSRSNRTSRAPALISASRKSHSVLASGTRSSGPSWQNRIHDSRSRTRYSVCSSDSPCSACSTSMRNFSTGSNGGLPPFQRGGVPSARTRTGRNISKSTVAASVSRGSPCAEISASRSAIDQNPI